MILCEAKQFLFIHVHRTGGTSVTEALTRVLTKSRLAFVGPGCNAIMSQHASVRQIQKEYDISKVFKFAFVRNPWDWILSQYTRALNAAVPHGHPFEVTHGLSFREYILKGVCHQVYDGIQQHDFLRGRSGQIEIDFIGRYERLQADFTEVLSRIGLSVDLQHINAQPHEPYRDAYDDEMIEKVRGFYRDDIELFGYLFNG